MHHSAPGVCQTPGPEKQQLAPEGRLCQGGHQFFSRLHGTEPQQDAATQISHRPQPPQSFQHLRLRCRRHNRNQRTAALGDPTFAQAQAHHRQGQQTAVGPLFSNRRFWKAEAHQLPPLFPPSHEAHSLPPPLLPGGLPHLGVLVQQRRRLSQVCNRRR